VIACTQRLMMIRPPHHVSFDLRTVVLAHSSALLRKSSMISRFAAAKRSSGVCGAQEAVHLVVHHLTQSRTFQAI
jgi:hypothetical protein